MPEGSIPRATRKKREKKRKEVREGEGRRLDIKKSLSRKAEFSNLRAGSTDESQDQQSGRREEQLGRWQGKDLECS